MQVVTSMTKFPNLLPPDVHCRVAAQRNASAIKDWLVIMLRDTMASIPWTEVLIMVGLLALALG
jgi:hypothetical protein